MLNNLFWFAAGIAFTVVVSGLILFYLIMTAEEIPEILTERRKERGELPVQDKENK